MNEIRILLEDSISKILNDNLDWDKLAEIEKTKWSASLWDSLKQAGTFRLFASEDNGGINGSWEDAYVVLRASAHHTCPLPLAESIIANYFGQLAGLLIPEDCWAVTNKLPNIKKNIIDLEELELPWGRFCRHFIIIDGNKLHLAKITDCEITEGESLGRDPLDLLTGKAEIVEEAALHLANETFFCVGALMRSAQIAGASAAAFDLSVKYTAEREQFGRPLSKFQAIQHYLADLAGLVASVDAISKTAFAVADSNDLTNPNADLLNHVAAAKCRASDAVEKITKLSHQVHGAIGFTYEYGLHYSTRRLWAWRADYGTSQYWGEHLGNQALKAGENDVWSLITK